MLTHVSKIDLDDGPVIQNEAWIPIIMSLAPQLPLFLCELETVPNHVEPRVRVAGMLVLPHNMPLRATGALPKSHGKRKGQNVRLAEWLQFADNSSNNKQQEHKAFKFLWTNMPPASRATSAPHQGVAAAGAQG